MGKVSPLKQNRPNVKQFRIHPWQLLPCALVASLVAALSPCALFAEHPGATIYRERCADCHGTDGQGLEDGFPDPLLGDYPVEVLARLVEHTMPEGDAESCVGEEADDVAHYVFNTFYSLRARIQRGLVAPPRVQLARLTVAQHRNVLADLIRAFTPVTRRRQFDPGLEGEYFQSKGMSKANALKLRRVDTSIDFDFGQGSPTELITTNDQFAIVWQGSLLAPQTGHYEFRVRSPNGVRLYLNNDPVPKRNKLRDDSSVSGQSALLDAWVSSGKMREVTARLFLLGGRRYPLRLEFFKYKESAASIRFEWKPPESAWSVVDHRHLNTAEESRWFICNAAFPADDRSLGYERGNSVSRQWYDATHRSAVEAANEITNRMQLLTGIPSDVVNRDALLPFTLRFAALAFRRPLTVDERFTIREVLFADATGPDEALRRAILLVLQSPSFLYTDLGTVDRLPSADTVSARLSLALWDSIPDAALRRSAERTNLNTRDEVVRQARRMLSDWRTRQKMREFFQHWLEMGERDLSKDRQRFPEFSAPVIDDLRYSLELMVDRIMWSERPDYRQLLTADYLVLNRRLRQIYAPEGSVQGSDSNTDFNVVSLSEGRRSGLLTHPYLLSALSYHNGTSPIHRGVFLTRNVVGRGLRPPPIAVAFREDEFAEDLTMREKITQLTSDEACVSLPLGNQFSGIRARALRCYRSMACTGESARDR